MRESRFTEEQIVEIVRESEREGMTVAQAAKKHGITETLDLIVRKTGTRQHRLAKSPTRGP